MKKHDNDVIRIKGAAVHNLKHVSLDIPKNKLVVITGLSGSGKSSLAFDTIYAEAERRFVESLSSYARQFLGIKEKPEVEAIDGLSPAISIDQKSIAKNPRSTVGTITEIYDYLRILFTRIGKPHCPQCKKPIGRQTVDEIIAALLKLSKTKEILILGPMIRDKKGEHRGIIAEAKQAGFLRARVDGTVYLIDDAFKIALDKHKKHSIEVVVDRFTMNQGIDRSRMRDSVEVGLKIGKGNMVVQQEAENFIFSETFACPDCGINIADIEPRTFSFNSPYGACPTCTGLGSTLEVDPELVIPNKRLSIAEGAIRPWSSASHRLGRQSWYWWILDDVAGRYHFSLNTPVENLSKEIINILLNGEEMADSDEKRGKDGTSSDTTAKEGKFEGVIANLKRRWKETDSDFTRLEIEKYMLIKTCAACNGMRLRPEALAVIIVDSAVNDKTIKELSALNACISVSYARI